MEKLLRNLIIRDTAISLIIVWASIYYLNPHESLPNMVLATLIVIVISVAQAVYKVKYLKKGEPPKEELKKKLSKEEEMDAAFFRMAKLVILLVILIGTAFAIPVAIYYLLRDLASTGLINPILFVAAILPFVIIAVLSFALKKEQIKI